MKAVLIHTGVVTLHRPMSGFLNRQPIGSLLEDDIHLRDYHDGN
jgi:hypothetical protein